MEGVNQILIKQTKSRNPNRFSFSKKTRMSGQPQPALIDQFQDLQILENLLSHTLCIKVLVWT